MANGEGDATVPPPKTPADKASKAKMPDVPAFLRYLKIVERRINEELRTSRQKPDQQRQARDRAKRVPRLVVDEFIGVTGRVVQPSGDCGA
jgi:hypothetical protein